jgi:hypothetical protein
LKKFHIFLLFLKLILNKIAFAESVALGKEGVLAESRILHSRQSQLKTDPRAHSPVGTLPHSTEP